MGDRLGRRFFDRLSPVVARDLLGKTLVRVVPEGRLAGTIVEAEAYRGGADWASHAYRGKTRRNEVMFGEPGHAYVYFTYGNHWMLNLTVEKEGTPAAVLLRAIEPTEGMGLMKRNRGVQDDRDVASGPGKLTKALAVTGALNGKDVTTSDVLFVEDRLGHTKIGRSTRVGISSGDWQEWRFFVEGNRFVSKGKPSPFVPRTHNYAKTNRGASGVVG